MTLFHTQLTGYPVSAAFVDRTTQVLQFSFCVLAGSPTPTWLPYFPAASQTALGILMCLFTAIRLIKELLQTHKVTRRVKLNRVRKGIIYFIVHVPHVRVLFHATMLTK